MLKRQLQKIEIRSFVAIAASMLLLSMVVFWPYLWSADILLGPRSGLGTDISYRHWPDLTYYARVLREEHVIPLWDYSVASGRPLAGDPGVLWLYPFDLVFLILPPALAFNWLAVFHIWVAGVGAYLFLRQGLRLSIWAALLGGYAYLLNPKVIAHLAGGHVGLVYGAAWIPWALLGTLWTTEGKWTGTLLAGLALTLQMPTHVQIPFYTAWLMVAYALWRIVSLLFTSGSVRGCKLAPVVGILPCFIAFAAVYLLPLLGLLPYTSRQGFSLQDAAWYSLPPALLFTLFSPTSFQFPEWVLYPGAVSLMLAFIAFLGPKRREAIFWGGVVLFALLHAVGTATPLFPLLHQIPGFAQLRVPPRLWFIGGFAVTVLAALGADGAIDSEASQFIRRRKYWLRWVILFVYGAEAATVVGLLIFQESFWRLLATLLVSLLAIGVLIVYYRGRLRGRTMQVMLLFLLLVDLLPTARLYTVDIPVDDLIETTPALDFFRQQPGLWRVYSSHGDLPYAPAAAMEVEAAEGLLALQIGHYVEFIKQASGCLVEGYGTGVPPCLTGEVKSNAYQQSQLRPALLGLLNVRYVLTPLIYDDPDLKLIAQFEDQRIYENQRWLPRSFVVFQSCSFPDQASVLDALSEVNLGRTALLADSFPLLSNEAHPSVPAEIIDRTANSMKLSVQIEQPGLLIISQTWMPGWRAWVDGESAKVHRVDYALQGVPLAAGEHDVYLRYQPIGWQVGWRLSLVSIGLALIAKLFLIEYN